MEVIDYFLFAVMHLVESDDVCRKVMEGDGKFGKLDLEGMEPGKEALQEIIDLFAYVHASKYTSAPL